MQIKRHSHSSPIPALSASPTTHPPPPVQPWPGRTVVEVSLLVHHEGLHLAAVVLTEGEGARVLRPELVLPVASEVDGIDQRQSSHAAEVVC